MTMLPFFSWASQRYPRCVQPVSHSTFMECDMLYIELGKLIRNCYYPMSPIAAPIEATESEIIGDIGNYIDHIVQLARPQKGCCLFMNGLLPGAVMRRVRDDAYNRYIRMENIMEAMCEEDEEPVAAYDCNAAMARPLWLA
ncbi:hypothetical protein THASP1DRAFT_33625 [Thamnocephalis sphaerospora]|uniref:Xrn1 N-terminal domain-containing protein n=1 Tax=Thamnocephalis sphaerospora TaxID=78915 RepID=A0A4P9XH60_9FUNG|nr:hypothetical protein THASP1DRAFT_33625 [Thamnocephalis sphaerospora]|eukprot:RKP04591.1 hypothetical protein THASP1DRAFT_33625 [Thamnocephalis sphaerospora]